ncbi:MAG: 50S ribosomal protein L18 [Candidatus Thermoplasmatota archaeon]
MNQGPRYRIKPRRQREGKTDYRKRLKLLKSGKPRIVIRRTLKHMRVQFIKYEEESDKVIASAFSKELESSLNWKYSTSNIPAAYLTGLLAGKRAKEEGIEEAVLDIGRQLPVTNSKIFASLKGVLDAGVECPHDEKKLPDVERIKGNHIKKEVSSKVEDLKNKITGGK